MLCCRLGGDATEIHQMLNLWMNMCPSVAYVSICCKNVMQYFAEMNKVNGPVSWLNHQN